MTMDMELVWGAGAHYSWHKTCKFVLHSTLNQMASHCNVFQFVVTTDLTDYLINTTVQQHQLFQVFASACVCVCMYTYHALARHDARV